MSAKRAPRATMQDAMNSQMFTPIAPDAIDTTFIGGRCARLEVTSISTRNSKLPLAGLRSSSNFARLP